MGEQPAWWYAWPREQEADWSHFNRSWEAERGKKWGELLSQQRLSSATNFLPQGCTSQRLHNLVKQHCQLETKCLDTWVHVRHFSFKSLHRWKITDCVHIPHSISSFIDAHIGWFHNLDVVHKDGENVSMNMLLTWKCENYSFHFPPFIENAFVWVEGINIYCNTLSRSSDFVIDILWKSCMSFLS